LRLLIFEQQFFIGNKILARVFFNFFKKLNKPTNNTQGDEMEVFLTKDSDILSQYYELRQTAYRDENGWADYDGSENKFDLTGKIVVAVENGKVIGGARATFSDQCQFLPNEIPGTQYDYRKFIRTYDSRENLILSEISALAVEKSHRDSNVTAAMVDILFKESIVHGCNYVVGVAVAAVCRSYRKTIKNLGYELEIVMNFPWKERKVYNFIKMFPVYTKLQ
jgi:hypothetical protein